MAAFRVLGVALLLAVWLNPLPAAAAADPKADATRIFQEVMSPFCPGLTLADCPSPQAFALRDEISRRLAAGETPDRLMSELVRKYGAGILADPTPTPIGAIAWGTPIALALMAACGLALFVRRSVERGHVDRTGDDVGNPALVQLLDDQLRALD